MTAPAVAAEAMYIGGRMVRRVSLETGETTAVWRPDSKVELGPPSVRGDSVFVVTDDGRVVALDSELRAPHWTSEVEADSEFAPVIAAGSVFVLTDHSLVSLDQVSGEVRWSFVDGLAAELSVPSVDGDLVFVSASDGRIHAVQVDDGETRWFSEEGVGFTRLPPLASGGNVGAIDQGGALHWFDAETGIRWWRRVLPTAPSSALASFPGHVITTSGASVYTLAAADGRLQSRRFLVEDGAAHAPVMLGGTVYCGGDSAVYAFDYARSALRWKVQFGSHQPIRTIVPAGDRLLVAAGTTIYALQAEVENVVSRQD